MKNSGGNITKHVFIAMYIFNLNDLDIKLHHARYVFNEATSPLTDSITNHGTGLVSKS